MSIGKSPGWVSFSVNMCTTPNVFSVVFAISVRILNRTFGLNAIGSFTFSPIQRMNTRVRDYNE